MDAYGSDIARTINSLILKMSSLFPEIFSLLICVGKFTKSRCSAAVSLPSLGSQSLKIAKFPVKFPVSREFGWRQARSALRGQPSSPALNENVPDIQRKARQWRAFANLPRSPGSGFLPFQGEDAESLRRDTGIFPFSGDGDRRLGFDRHYVAELAV